MKLSIAVLIALVFSLTGFAQQRDVTLAGQAQQATMNPVTQSGVTGSTTYYYWVVAAYTGGKAAPAGPATVFTSNATLSSSNYNIVNFTAPASSIANTAPTFDVLRTTTNTPPSGACACAVATGQASSPVNDQSNTTSAYTVSTVTGGGQIYMDLVNSTNAAMTISVNNVIAAAFQGVASGVNIFMCKAAATGGEVLCGPTNAGADANAPLGLTSNGTGAIDFFTGAGGREQFQVLNTAGTVIDFLTVKGDVTATHTPVIGVGTTTDAAVSIQVSPKATGQFTVLGSTETNPGFLVDNVASAADGLRIIPATTGGSVILSSNHTGADANAPFTITSNGTGQIDFETGSTARKQFTILNTNGTIINHLTVTGAATTAFPVVGIGTTTDANVSMQFQPKGTGQVAVTDGTDTTKVMSFNAAGNGTGITQTISSTASAARTLTIPDASITIPGTQQQECGTTNSCGHTNTSPTAKIVTGHTAALNAASPSIATVSGISPAFSGTTNYVCTGTVEGNAAQVHVLAISYVSASSFTFTGPNGATDVISYICIGN